MSKMFTNYESSFQDTSYLPPVVEHTTEPKLVTNINGEVLGVQINHSTPLQLYFHLENTWEVDFAEILAGNTLFEILTTTHKSRVSREFLTSEILNQDTFDLCISLTAEEMELLKKETYNMKVTLKTATQSFIVFAEKDGYLVIR